MENKRSNTSQSMEKASRMERAAETMCDTVIAILDKLAGKKSDLKLCFEDLTLDTGIMNARINGVGRLRCCLRLRS
jgi:hypothetical protein